METRNPRLFKYINLYKGDAQSRVSTKTMLSSNIKTPCAMIFKSLSPFIPSGKDFNQSKNLFQALGFTITWDAGDYVGFQRDNSSFILQHFDNRQFAENLMVNISVSNIREFWDEINSKELTKKFNVRFTAPAPQPYGMEVNMIDLAGVCWHFVE
jgi:hypothetical protein